MFVVEAARTYIVPSATLKIRLARTNCFAVEHKQTIGSISDLFLEVEQKLVAPVLQLEEYLLEITLREL